MSHCQYCNKRIGFVRALYDHRYCSSEHHRAAGSRSAKHLRDLGELDYHTVTGADLYALTADEEHAKRTQSSARGTATAIGLLVLAGAILFQLDTSAGAPAPAGARREPSWVLGKLDGALAQLPRGAEVQLQQRFASPTVLGSWTAAAANLPSDWSIDNGLLRPGGLRIWSDSRTLADYRFQFEGSIERSAIDWAVRATDHRNFYGAKLILSGRATEIERYVTIAGRESRRTRLPLPVTLSAGQFYDFEVQAQGDRFLTLVGGRVIDTWRDNRLRTGGVGFFTEGQEKAAIRWARLTSGGSFVDRLRGYLTFGLILPLTPGIR